jgi:hypothetical protein
MIKAALISFCIFTVLCSYQTPRCLLLSYKNSTGEDFKKLEVFTYDGIQVFYDLKKGQSTKPIAVTSSYRFTWAKAVTTSDTISTPGYCRTGETVFTEGRMMMNFTFISFGDDTKKYLVIDADVQAAPAGIAPGSIRY